ncbi:MAG: ATP-dependent helicase, partial [Patescibacteria group bacterium]|nr:ATP-dependent helicase [Patescibacteria group bacterium]
QVHPEIAEIDEKFKMASEEAEEGFEKLSKEDIEKMHRNFISASGGVMREVADKSEKQQFKKAHTTEITLALWKEGQTLDQIAKTRKLKKETILSHVEELLEKKKIAKDELSRLVTSALSKKIERIVQEFNSLDTHKLTEVFESLKGKYSYDEIRLARLFVE